MDSNGSDPGKSNIRKLTSIRFKPELASLIKRIAEKEGLTFTDAVEKILEQALPEHKSLTSRLDNIEKMIRKLVKNRGD